MKTSTTKATIGPDRLLTVQLPADVVPGEHEVVVVLNGMPVSQPMPDRGPYPTAPIDRSFTFRREDMYGDDGR